MPRNSDRDRGHRQQQQHHHQGSDHGGAGGGGDSDDRRKPRRNFYRNDYKNRGSSRYYGKHRNFNSGGDRGDRRNFKRAKFDVGERLKEVDLGITEYIGADIEGFSGTIKERFTDFMVHEISLTGEIAQLTNQNIPPDPEDNIDIEDLKKKIPEAVWEKLKKIEDCEVEIDVTNMDKDQRKCIHQIVKKMTTVYSETKDTGDKKIIVFSKEYSNQYGYRRDNRKDWSARGGDYCHFILHKYNMDTMDALNQLSRVLHLKPSIFNYAGTKDRRAKTSQWISVKKMNPKNIRSAACHVRGLFVGNFKFEKAPLKLGKLYGNRFTIALRNVTAADDHIEKAMISLRDKGFINYYGLQRFGTIAAIPTHEIGKALLQGNWEEAVNLILKPREGEQDHNLAEAREVYQKTKDARQAYQKLGRTDKLEAKLLWGLNICGHSNLQGALDMVPRNTMLMYIHAYQSKMWNEVVSRRIKEFGLKPIAGDLVYENPDAKDDFIFDNLQHEVEEANKSTSDEKVTSDATGSQDEKIKESEDSAKAVETNENKTKERQEDEENKNNSKKEDDKDSEKDDGERRLPIVKILTEEDLSNYTMEDVIMPQPGWKVVYPPYAKNWFDEKLEKDSLTPELKQKNKKYTLSGSYRKVLEIPKNLSWKIVHYNNKNDDLILSDIDELRDVEPIKDDPMGKFKALIIQMSLKSSAYATMALREALKCDTSSQTHAAQSAAFHEAHEKQEAQQHAEEDKLNAETSDCESIPHVENLELKDNSSDEPSQLNEDETGEKRSNASLINSTLLEDSMIEDEASNTLKFNKTTSSMLEVSVAEEKPTDQSISAGLQKHETDPANDSGLETSTVINA